MRRLFAVLVASATLGMTPTLSASSLTEAVARCAGIPEDAERLACFDRLAEKPSRQSGGDEPVEAASVPEPYFIMQDEVGEDDVPLLSAVPESAKDKAGSQGRWLGIRPYRRNYILPVSYNSRLNDEQALENGRGFEPENVEIKFQLSFELPVWRDLLVDDLDVYFA